MWLEVFFPGFGRRRKADLMSFKRGQYLKGRMVLHVASGASTMVFFKYADRNPPYSPPPLLPYFVYFQFVITSLVFVDLSILLLGDFIQFEINFVH